MKTTLLLPLLLPLLTIPLASATIPTLATGSFTASFTVLSITSSDGNTVITVSETATLTGPFTGTRTAVGFEIVHPDGTFNAHDTGTFTGTVNGASGTLVITGDSTGLGATGSGQFTVGQGTAALEGFHAQGPFQFIATGPTTTSGTYSVQLHSEP